MNSFQRLRDMETDLGQPHPEIDVATALIASHPPEVLDEARNETYLTGGFAALVSSEVRSAEADYDRILESSNSVESKKEARKRLEQLLADEAEASQTKNEYSRDLRLARGIDKKRDRLARPLRWRAAMAGAAVLGMLGGSFVALSESDNNRSHNKNTVEHVQSGDSLSEKQEIGAALYAGAMGIAGGIGGFVLIGSKRAKKYAHKRAKKIVESTF